MKEVSAGIIIFKEKPKREYLLLHYQAGHWDFPKGNLEKKETNEEAARRELEEETGIKNVEMLNGFEQEITYFYKKKGQLVHKTAIFFLGKIKDEKIKLSNEHKNYKWQTYEEALNTLTYDNAKELLKKAERFLKK